MKSICRCFSRSFGTGGTTKTPYNPLIIRGFLFCVYSPKIYFMIKSQKFIDINTTITNKEI